MTHSDELASTAKQLQEAAQSGESTGVSGPLQAVEEATNVLNLSFSGSWLGYHSRVYYRDFLPPPAGAHFSVEWGIQDRRYSSLGSTGDWREYDLDAVKAKIEKLSGVTNLDGPRQVADSAAATFSSSVANVLSILETELNLPDSLLAKLKAAIEELKPLRQEDVLERWVPCGQIVTRDMVAIGQGNLVPPHIAVRAMVASIRSAFDACARAAELSANAASHLQRKNTAKHSLSNQLREHVVIGHGRTHDWRELKDFVQDRLNLKWDEFNRVPVAGITNIERLRQMLDAGAIAFLVMTAEDEMKDGNTQPRMNVVHEAGLFQGRLGFAKAIILLEDGCTEFTNIQGLGQLRFPKGRISAIFEDVRRILEREGILA